MPHAPLWTLDALARATRGAVIGEPAAAIGGVSIDSRSINAGDAFFAIRGDRFDGHDFVASALAQGAAVAVVSRDFAASAPAGRYLVVPDVLEAMRAAGRAARARTAARIAAITGSVGKTSTKEALAAVLARHGATHFAVASFNNHWGVPLTLARMPAASAFGVFEVGMNHADEITPLARMVRPHVAIITTVEAVHIENFPETGILGIADAKAEVFNGLEPGGVAVLNKDNPHFDRLVARAREAGAHHVVSFGAHEDAEVRLMQLALKPDCSCVVASVMGVEIAYKLGAPGRHLALNSLAVLAAAKLMGADLAAAGLALADLRAVKGRGEQHVLAAKRGPFTLIDESYNANPVSMRAALAVLGATEIGLRGRRIAVMGDMLELGPQGPADHAGIAEAVEEHRIDLVFCCGPLMKRLWDRLPASRRGAYAASSADLEPQVVAALQAGDAVMVKGSLGSRMGPIVETLKRRFAARLDAPAVGAA